MKLGFTAAATSAAAAAAAVAAAAAGVTGRFPRLWAGLTSLQVLDVSATGVIP
jgi:hypothetical protein